MMTKTKILIVDDHRVVIEGIKSALSVSPDLEVIGEALNGHQAIKKVKSLKPDIVIMDISMPELNGIDATLQIKKLDPQIKIIIFSMYSNREYVIDLFKAGISSYVLKKDPMSELVNAIKAVERGGTYFTTISSEILLNYVKELDGDNINEFESLSLREREVFQSLAEGKSIKAVAEILGISRKTVETHKYNIMEKLHAQNITDLTKLAIKKGILQL
ncbi:MAG TPA: response regulator transcription factor [Thermodesulfobacteriota bacterium]|nr:response regulator transcription factor [Thermodesulfobacteriota bacterium]